MQKTSENWSKICHCAGKPIVELTELNAKSMNKLAEQAKALHACTETKRPEDLISTQLNAMNIAGTAIAEYNRKVSEIIVNSLTEAGKIWSDVLQDSAGQAAGGWGKGIGGGVGTTGEGGGSSRQK